MSFNEEQYLLISTSGSVSYSGLHREHERSGIDLLSWRMSIMVKLGRESLITQIQQNPWTLPTSIRVQHILTAGISVFYISVFAHILLRICPGTWQFWPRWNTLIIIYSAWRTGCMLSVGLLISLKTAGVQQESSSDLVSLARQ